MGRTFGEIESECRLIGSEIVDMKNELLGQVLLAPPDDPPDARIH